MTHPILFFIAIAFFWLKGEGRSLFFWLKGEGRSLFIFTVRGDRCLSLSVRGDRCLSLSVRGDRFFLAKGRGAIAFFWLKGEGRSLFSG
jgi:hypothetical protein